MRTLVLICLLAATALSGWSAFEMHSLLVGSQDGEIVYPALAASCLATIVAVAAISLTVRHRREWPGAYIAGSFGVALFSLIVGIWAWAAV